MSVEDSIFDVHEFVRIREDDGSWQALEANWRAQCEKLDEDFDAYAGPTFEVVTPLARAAERRAGLFALKDGLEHLAICQVNSAMLPKYDGPVMRVRFITLSPEFDLTDKNIRDYGDILVSLLYQVVRLAITDENFGSRHIKFHARSPSDINFFSALSHGLRQGDAFHSVQMSGAWLYITRK
ncbi:hypothetical protein F9K98_10740 [Brucella anthropi]|uniref:hypothetical protein n=1 Tax=Brucella anthropi TaxID=529 RepID=UPI00124D7805|nr:hypothetical protein [Brucella anthropi]KAB2762305.1 hypothetical protein F9K98_10740 [Brucella anthropi]